jgi:glyoxylase-like metal-dependent hydrolase (beta-lactamase superfamily II)
VEPELAGAFLLQDGSEAAFIETNTTPAVPRLLQTLERAGLPRESVRYIIVTHVHLDHAGGTSSLLAACPQATVLAHPRAARHLIDPSKLVASARNVYGDEVFARLYGQIDPIPAQRVREFLDEEEVEFGRSRLRFLHTRGHAKHHFCVLDPTEMGIFTGDAFGLRYPRLQRAGLFLFPSTSPTDFEPDEARKSAVRIARSGVETAYLTHFGAVSDLRQCEAQLLEGIDLHERVLLALQAQGERTLHSPLERVTAETFKALREEFRKKFLHRGWNLSESDLAFLDLDLRLNAAGLVHVARTRLSPT